MKARTVSDSKLRFFSADLAVLVRLHLQQALQDPVLVDALNVDLKLV